VGRLSRVSAQLLKDAAGTYLYISSTGVFYPYLTADISEDTELVLVDESEGENGASWYGVMKALSEIEARSAFGERACIVRPGYIVGPLDRTHRGTYWPDRLTRGGEVLVPGKKSDLVQQIDVRDLTEWIIHLLENEVHGVFNATGPSSPITMEEFVYAMRGATSSEVTWTWIEDYDFLIDRAKAAGLEFRPIAQTAMETLEWYYTLTEEKRANPAHGTDARAGGRDPGRVEGAVESQRRTNALGASTEGLRTLETPVLGPGDDLVL
jgi:2'-hydroxyisoflavone reductase